MWRYRGKNALRDRMNLSRGSEGIPKVAVLPSALCCVSFCVPIVGLLTPKDGRRRSRGDETSHEIPLDFLCLEAVFPRKSLVGV